ncbi:MAG: hypothetical protein ABI867_22455 [Kofleriaceae bacterium]
MRWLVACSIVLGLVAPAVAKPHLELASQRGNVTVYAESGLAGLGEDLAEQAADVLERIHADLYGLRTPPRIEIRLVRDAKDLAAVAPEGRGAPAWAIGVAYPELGIISIATRRDANYAEPIATLRHELAHLALGAALGARAPHWLHEGFAYQHSAEWSRDRIETLAGMAWLDTIIPLDQLDASFPSEELPANRAYAESYDFVGFLSRRGRWDDSSDDGDRFPFRRFLREIANGAAPDAAAIQAFGRPLRALFLEWKEDMQNRYRLMPIGLLGFALWIFCALLLVLAWARRRHQNRKRVAQWDLDEAARRERLSQVMAPPYVAWPGEDPFDEDPEDDPPGGPTRLMN